MILLDTSILIDLLHNDQSAIRLLETIPSDKIYISAITLAEVELGHYLRRKDKKTDESIEILSREEVNILPVDRLVARKYAQIQGDLLKQGEQLSQFDAIIAATAITHNLQLVTRDQDFRRVKGLGLYYPSRG